jgi:hypothetical protein
LERATISAACRFGGDGWTAAIGEMDALAILVAQLVRMRIDPVRLRERLAEGPRGS